MYELARGGKFAGQELRQPSSWASAAGVYS